MPTSIPMITRRPALLLVLVAALACGKSAGQREPQTVSSVSAPDSAQRSLMACVDVVLDASSQVERISTSRRSGIPLTRYVALTNPPSERSRGLLFTVLSSRGASREVVVAYDWPGPWQGTGGMKPQPDPKDLDIEGAMLADISSRLLREVRAECAPSAPGEPACSRVAQGRGGRCVLAT